MKLFEASLLNDMCLDYYET